MRVRDWPGLAGPLVHVPEPLSSASSASSVDSVLDGLAHVPDPLSVAHSVIDGLADALAPRYRVLSVSSRGDAPYQVDAGDLIGVLSQFGFRTPVLVGERLGCVTALVAAAWYPDRVAGLILANPVYDPPRSETVAARALRDCPPDWSRLRAALRCRVLENSAPEAIEVFLAVTLP